MGTRRGVIGTPSSLERLARTDEFNFVARAPLMIADTKPNKKKKNTFVVDLNKNLKPTPNSTQALNVTLRYIYSGEVDLENYSPFLVS
jgi:hypothetical protein